MLAIPGYRISLLNVLLCFSLFIKPSRAVAQCECQHQLRVGDVFSLAKASPLPLLPVAAAGLTSELPFVIRLEVGTNGRVCTFLPIEQPVPELTPHIEAAVRKWRFRQPVFVKDKPDKPSPPRCLVTKIFLYYREQHGRFLWFIPGLTKETSE
jgi:hypothetical protein